MKASASEWVGRGARDLAANLSFFTRLPLPSSFHGKPEWARIAWAAPLAGALIGAIGGVTLLCARALDLPPTIISTLAVGAMAIATGA